MELVLTQEHDLLIDTARRIASAADVWSALADSGLLGLCLPEAHGGAGATVFDTMLVCEALAANGASVPYVSQGALAPLLRQQAGAFEATVALAADLGSLGHTIVWDGERADWAAGVEAGGAVVRVHAGDPLDALDIARSAFRSAGHEPLGVEVSEARLAWLNQLGAVLTSAELLGVMQCALNTSVTYAGDRRQFGVPVGSFQALQHLAADAAVIIEGARALIWYAAWALDNEPSMGAQAAHQAKAYSSHAAVHVAETAVQMHGGIAITWEHPAHRWLRAALSGAALFGGERFHLQSLAALRLGEVAP